MSPLLPVRDSNGRLQAQPPVYDLFAVSNHFGGLGGGHYTAFCKDAGSDDWSNFDDSHVSPVPISDSVVSPAAYMLFYRRQSEAARDSGMASSIQNVRFKIMYEHSSQGKVVENKQLTQRY